MTWDEVDPGDKVALVSITNQYLPCNVTTVESVGHHGESKTIATRDGRTYSSREWHVGVLVKYEPPKMPDTPGIYVLAGEKQEHMADWHTDGFALHFLNTENHWVDVGWGNASEADAGKLRMVCSVHALDVLVTSPLLAT